MEVSPNKPYLTVDHDSVVLESAAGVPIVKFPFEPYYTGKAMLAAGEIVVFLADRPRVFGQPHHCKRSGACEPIGSVLAFDGAEALGAQKVEGACAFVRLDLRTGAQVTIPVPKEITSAVAVPSGWVLGLAGGTLAHVSRATGAIDRESGRDPQFLLPILGAVGDRVVLGESGPDVLVVDPASWTVTDHYVLGDKGYLHVDRAGRFAISGEAKDLESYVVCSDGRQSVPREACRQRPAPAPGAPAHR